MPKEYIEREATKEHIQSCTGMFTDELGFVVSLEAVIRGIEFQSTADVVEVVRCGECIHHSRAITPGRVICDKHAILRNDTDFCSDGRRDKPEN